MNKETLRMQMLAGIITESKYKQLLEDMEVVDRILDKISAQGKDSLTPDEKSYLDRYSKGEKNLIEPTSGGTKVYTSSPYVELYKIENFPPIPKNIHSINFNCTDTNNPETCENSDEMQELFNKSPKIKSILNKINTHAFEGDEVYFHRIDFEGNFSSPIETAYAQVSGDGMLYIVDSLSQFSDNYQTEEGWGVESWSQI